MREVDNVIFLMLGGWEVASRWTEPIGRNEIRDLTNAGGKKISNEHHVILRKCGGVRDMRLWDTVNIEK